MARAPSRIKAQLKRLVHYKSFIAGVVILAFFIALSIYAMVTWPYSEAIAKWNNPAAWLDYPKNAKPSWITIFTGVKELEGSLIIDTRLEAKNIVKLRQVLERFGKPFAVIEQVSAGFTYDYDAFPARLVYTIFVNTTDRVFVNLTWRKPNGVEIIIEKGYFASGELIRSLEPKPGEVPEFVLRYVEAVEKAYGTTVNISNVNPTHLLFCDDEYFAKTGALRVLKGNYQIRVETFSSDINSTVDLKLVIQGTVYGLAGTDFLGRDLFMAIAWGAPVAIAFGLTASLLSALLQMAIAAISAWFAGAVDMVIQRINEIFMVLPFLPTIVMLWMFYGFDLWTLLWVIVLFSAWGGGVKTSRAMFLQIKEMPYIEAAKAYGASGFRIVLLYMIPRVIPVIIPSIVTAIPSFVFLEAALAVLGIADPRTITWGKVLQEAYVKGALLQGYYHWILAPSIMLFLMGIGFAMIGFTLDRVFNPRLREI
ncbi:MAG: ABC transporter permease [Desulfurococcaceae archaeon]